MNLNTNCIEILKQYNAKKWLTYRIFFNDSKNICAIDRIYSVLHYKNHGDCTICNDLYLNGWRQHCKFSPTRTTSMTAKMHCTASNTNVECYCSSFYHTVSVNFSIFSLLLFSTFLLLLLLLINLKPQCK